MRELAILLLAAVLEVGGDALVRWGLTGGNDLMTAGNMSSKKILPERKMSIEDYFPMGIWRPVRLEIVPRIHL